MTYLQPNKSTRSLFKHPTKEEVLSKLRGQPEAYHRYLSMDEMWRARITDFFEGKRTLPLLYDNFFKLIFHPDIHPDRLSRFISSILGMKVQVIDILPNEDTYISGEKLVIMDIIVELEDGSITNVEIQKCPYAFPGERISCYLSDLILRQYIRVKGNRGKEFKYGDLKNVYTIVIYEKSTKNFHQYAPSYLHKGRFTYDSGIHKDGMDLLQHNYIIALDVFREFAYHEEVSELAGWLSLLSTEQVSDIDSVIARYPWLEEIYQEIASFQRRPGEVISMYSNIIAELDRNTMQYMIDEYQEQIKKQEAIIEENASLLEEQSALLEEQSTLLGEKDAEIARLKKLLKQS